MKSSLEAYSFLRHRERTKLLIISRTRPVLLSILKFPSIARATRVSLHNRILNMQMRNDSLPRGLIKIPLIRKSRHDARAYMHGKPARRVTRKRKYPERASELTTTARENRRRYDSLRNRRSPRVDFVNVTGH